jgi:transcription-repair coupling factor (superfamily II helicase)
MPETERDAALGPLVDALAAHPALRAARAAGGRPGGAAGGGPGGRRATLGGLWGSASAMAAGLLTEGRGRAVLVAPTAEAAEALLLDLSVLFPGRSVALLPVEEEGLGEGPELAANRSERLVALAGLREPGDGLLVVPGPVLLETLPQADGRLLTLRQGQVVEREALLTTLVEAGLARVPLVAAPGEVSLRGDILDVYPWAATHPVRLELLDDEVEQIRRFEVDDQRSVARLDDVTLPLGGRPAAPDAGGPGGRGGAPGRRLADVLPADAFVLVIDPPRLKDRLAEVAFEHGQAPREIAAALAALAGRPGADLFPLDLGEPGSDVSLGSVGGDMTPQEQRIAAWRAQGRQIVVLCDTEAEASRLGEILAERGVAPGTDLALHPGRLTAGFVFPASGPVLAHHHELHGRRPVRRRRPRRVVATRALDSLAELHPGDHVVHLTHGVAVYRGMERLAREQGEEDFLVLEFAEETRLYVPASRIDLVERFVGGDARGPKLDRVGGRTWKRRREKVARAVADLASELLSLAAARGGGEGYAFPPDDPSQARFEAAFPYEDTPDQETAWNQIRADMEGPRPMDRLLVGDVGFGKTEVAVRAAFKAVLAGRQVAMLVPTTILAEQHHETFARRMAEEPVRIEVLSRFVGEAAQRTVLADLAAGRVDVVIGTHRLLGDDVAIPGLGLLIVDEEQRFGVAHKERLKRLRQTVDVLTLSATPIPRTLHMALSGLRDIASIGTPPPGRRPVLTKVGYDEDGTLRAAILHETGRGGQVFVLHNRVAGIGAVVERVRRLVPTASTGCAHGQLAAAELRDVVEAFTDGELDVLVCTSIIESGIDIPRANTIVVTDSHRYGLADLHQLRGRVGREQTQAYAHFLVPRDAGVGEGAERRLKAIEEYASLGSGLPIALRDLELRGAGNLLGAEQSGHILTVGYDMYCRLLRRAVDRARGKTVEEEPGEIEVELGSAAFLPADYVPDAGVRMSLLRRMASAGARRLDALERELADRFGRVPPPARELLALFRLRRLVRLAGLSSLLLDGFCGLVLTVTDEEAWAARGPFARDELTTLSPGRWRYALPEAVRTPEDRLAHLLQRFTGRARGAHGGVGRSVRRGGGGALLSQRS